MKLEVGMYVRTNKGIFQIRNKNVFIEDKKQYIGVNGRYTCIDIETIEKASHNIIDLIEENDYINGLRVEKNKYGELYTSYVYYGGDIGKMCEVYTTWLKEYKEDEIYSIVTKEQFSQMEYKVVE